MVIKLKKLIKESKYAFDRKFGDPLPTFKGVMEKHTGRMLTEKKELDSKTLGYIQKMTDTNNHNEARLMLAKSFLGKNSPLVSSYEAIKVLHGIFNQMNELMKAREKLDKMLFKGANRIYSNMDDIQGAF